MQSGFIAVNPCTGNDITEDASVDCIGALSVLPDGAVVDGYNTKVRSVWRDTKTNEVFQLTGSGIVVFDRGLLQERREVLLGEAWDSCGS